jgi:hypothetical protein
MACSGIEKNLLKTEGIIVISKIAFKYFVQTVYELVNKWINKTEHLWLSS